MLYLVDSLDVVTRRLRLLDSAPLSEAEIALHRPDLPYVAARTAEAEWGDDLAHVTSWSGTLDGLQAPEIALLDDRRGRPGPPVHVRADDGHGFTFMELLQKATEIRLQNSQRHPALGGIGIYRAGLARGVPSFYLWGHRSRYELATNERPGND